MAEKLHVVKGLCTSCSAEIFLKDHPCNKGQEEVKRAKQVKEAAKKARQHAAAKNKGKKAKK